MQTIKQILRKKYSIPEDAFIVGSFVRDTEGAGISQGVFLPKLEKGADLLGDYLVKEQTRQPKLHVVLAGWRRQYIILRLENAKIPYTYFELPSQEVLNELYQTIDLFPITARYEGGPQSLIEAGMLGIKVVSRPVGIAEAVLTTHAISDDVAYATPEVPNVEHLRTPGGYAPFIELLKEISK